MGGCATGELPDHCPQLHTWSRQPPDTISSKSRGARNQNMQQIEGVSELLLVCCATRKDVVPFLFSGPRSAKSTVLMVGVRLLMQSNIIC